MGRLASPVRSQFAALRWRLLLSSSAVIGLTLGVGAIGIYHGIAHSLYNQLDRSLFNLADAAAHSLPETSAGVHPVDASQDDHPSSEAEPDSEPEADRDDRVIPVPGPETPHPYLLNELGGLDNDGDLDLPWWNLKQPDQAIEWFDLQGKLQFQAGSMPLDLPLNPRFGIDQVEQYRLMTVPVYIGAAGAEPQGYVRVSTPTLAVDNELRRLRQAMVGGGAAALGVCALGSWLLMRLAMGPIESSFERLRQFTADASHELRSPLTAIKTSLEVMQHHPERIHQADVGKLNAMTNATQQMTALVDDLLLLTRLDHSLQPDSWRLFPLDELLEDLMDSYSLQAQALGIDLNTQLQPTWVRGDVNQLKRVFTNLLDNALKYTPTGGEITVSCQVQESSVGVQVKDTGIGIDPAHLPQVFDRFWRADQVRSHQDGSGLGLAIVKGIVQAHQGSIALTSQLDQGTTVRIKLPRAAVPATSRLPD